MTISVNTSTLLPGFYDGWINFAGAGTTATKDSPQGIYFSLTIVPQCSLQVSPGNLSFAAVSQQAGVPGKAGQFNHDAGMHGSRSVECICHHQQWWFLATHHHGERRHAYSCSDSRQRSRSDFRHLHWRDHFQFKGGNTNAIREFYPGEIHDTIDVSQPDYALIEQRCRSIQPVHTTPYCVQYRRGHALLAGKRDHQYWWRVADYRSQ